jgi:hypothetical protein
LIFTRLELIFIKIDVSLIRSSRDFPDIPQILARSRKPYPVAGIDNNRYRWRRSRTDHLVSSSARGPSTAEEEEHGDAEGEPRTGHK